MITVVNAVWILAVIGAACAVVLIAAAKFMAVPVDEKFPLIRDCLAGANCGACGFAGCDGYAQALVDGTETNVTLCTPGGKDVANNIAGLLGVDAGDAVEMRAHVKCNGTCEAAKSKYEYEGVTNCSAANILFSGSGMCTAGCMGYGDCEKVCPAEAIHVIDGVAKVHPLLCIGCGICAKTCPKHIIEMKPLDSKVVVECSNTDKGAVTRKACSNGCIGCMKCQKTCQHDAIHVENNVASIDYSKCTSCGECMEGCPVKCIKMLP